MNLNQVLLRNPFKPAFEIDQLNSGVFRYENGTVDWGTKDNKPRSKPW